MFTDYSSAFNTTQTDTDKTKERIIDPRKKKELHMQFVDCFMQ